MKKNLFTKIAILVGIVLIPWLLIKLAINLHDARIVAAFNNQISNQYAVMASAADAVRQNASDATTNLIITDCAPADRGRFDTLLDSLSNTITRAELVELDTLFYKCGSYFAERKSLLAVLFRREVTGYLDLLALQTTVTANTSETDAAVELWQKIIDAELKTAEYFAQLVTQQGAIIALLKSGKPVNSSEVTEILSDVQNVRNQIMVLSTQIEEHRTLLKSI